MPDRIRNTIDEVVQSSTAGEDILQTRRETLRQKLDVLVATLHTRLAVHADTKTALGDEIGDTTMTLERLRSDLAYNLPIARPDLDRAYASLQHLTREARSRDSECWRDLVALLRDILNTWQELQGAIARAQMIDDMLDDDRE